MEEIKKLKILILTAHTGGGHKSIAEGLKDLLEPEFAISIVDPLPKVINTHYAFMGRHAPWMWATEYHATNNKAGSVLLHEASYQIGRKKLLTILQEHHPDAIISTHHFLTLEILRTLKKLQKKIPFIIIFTDPMRVHQMWLVEKDIDCVLAPTKETYQQAIEEGFSLNKIIAGGWPIKKVFYEQNKTTESEQIQQKIELLREMKLDPDTFTIFLQGGGDGATHIAKTAKAIHSRCPETQIILAAGKNTELQEMFTDIPRIYPLPFTDEIAKYMKVSDIVMGKAGPNSLFEAITLEKPFVITSFMPGQEKPNIELVEQAKIGWSTLTTKEQVNLVNMLVRHPELISSYKENIMRYRDANMQGLQHMATAIKKVATEGKQ